MREKQHYSVHYHLKVGSPNYIKGKNIKYTVDVWALTKAAAAKMIKGRRDSNRVIDRVT